MLETIFVNKRFLLQRLNWLTYKGPSATRNIPTSAPALGSVDYDMWLLTRPDVSSIRFGLTSAFLQQGTAANILKYFGLVWRTLQISLTPHKENDGIMLAIAEAIRRHRLSSLLIPSPALREPDFFELLQAGIINSSLGDGPAYSDPGLPSFISSQRCFTSSPLERI